MEGWYNEGGEANDGDVLGSSYVSSEQFSETCVIVQPCSSITTASKHIQRGCSGSHVNIFLQHPEKLAAIATSLEVEFSHSDHFYPSSSKTLKISFQMAEWQTKTRNHRQFDSSDFHLIGMWWPPETGSDSFLKKICSQHVNTTSHWGGGEVVSMWNSCKYHQCSLHSWNKDNVFFCTVLISARCRVQHYDPPLHKTIHSITKAKGRGSYSAPFTG